MSDYKQKYLKYKKKYLDLKEQIGGDNNEHKVCAHYCQWWHDELTTKRTSQERDNVRNQFPSSMFKNGFDTLDEYLNHCRENKCIKKRQRGGDVKTHDVYIECMHDEQKRIIHLEVEKLNKYMDGSRNHLIFSVVKDDANRYPPYSTDKDIDINGAILKKPYIQKNYTGYSFILDGSEFFIKNPKIIISVPPIDGNNFDTLYTEISSLKD